MKNTVYRCVLMMAAFVLISCGDMARSSKTKQSTPQELINNAVDRVELTVAGKENITAEALTSNSITASGFDATLYTIEYKNIAGNNAQKTANITFRLVKGALHSKERTVTITGFKAKETAAPPTPQELINNAVDRVELTVANKENITAEALTDKTITASGFDATLYTIEYKNIAGNNAQKTANVTFRLVKGALHSKERTVTITGFKAKETAAPPTPQELINNAVDKVELTVAGKENITAEALTSKSITANGFDTTLYTIEYKNIAGNNAQKTANITFRLVKGALHSKERTVTITGFKAKETAAPPTPQELINNAVDRVELTVAGKENITAEALTSKSITANGFDATLYTIEYKNIAGNNAQKTANVTFRLVKGALHSKERTVTITGFKAQHAAVSAEELIPVLGLQKGTMTASTAAKKAAEMKGLTTGAFQFDDIAIVHYDDKRGEFTLKLIGKKNENTFDTQIHFSEFPHPFAQKHLQSLIKLTLNYDKAIEENYSLSKYITEMEKDPTGETYLKEYSFSLDDPAHTTVSYGSDKTEYMLSAKLASSGTEIKVTPVFKLIYRKKTDSAAGEMIEKIKDMTIVHPHTVPYFTADDVFNHILNKLDNDFIKQNTAVFASSIAAPARALHTTPANLFDFEQIQSYTNIYNEKNVDEHLQLKDITAAIYNVKNGGITADDTQGTLAVQCWISTKEKIADYNNSTNPQPPAINTFKEFSRSDFKKADAATLRSMFEFKILKAERPTPEKAKDTWKKRSIPLSGQPAYHLLSKNNDNYEVKGLPPLAGMPFRMTINDGETPAHYFACSTGKLSKGSGGTEILLEGVVLRKPAGEERLSVTFVLSNNQQVAVTYPHDIH